MSNDLKNRKVPFLFNDIISFIKSIFEYIQNRSIGFYVLWGFGLFFSMPFCFIVLLAMRKDKRALQESIEAEAAHWRDAVQDNQV